MKLCWLALLPVVAMAQLTPNSVTVTASRTTTLASDQIVYNVSIAAPPDAGFDEVVAAASAAGITAASLRGIDYSSNSSAGPSWLFEVRAPLNNSSAAVGLLNAVAQSLAKDKRFSLSFYVGGSTLSADAQAAQKCPYADLIAEARAKATSMASAGGTTVGAMQALSGSTTSCFVTARFGLGGGGPTAADSITATATTVAPTPAPSNIAVTLNVSTDAGAALDNVVQAVAATGVTAGDLYSVGQNPYVTLCSPAGAMMACYPVQWSFRYIAPLSKWKDILASLTQVRSSSHPGITVDYQISADSPAAPDCVLPTVLSQAGRLAQDLAAAGGVRVGQLLAVSDGSAVTTQPIAFAAALSVSRVFSYVPPATVSGCSAVAQYAMLH